MGRPAGNPEGNVIYTGPSPRGWHRLQLAAECLQKYAWTYAIPPGEREKQQESSRPALVRGKLAHLAQAQHYAIMRAEQRAARGEPDSPDAWCPPEVAVPLIAELEGGKEHVNHVMDTYNAYCNVFPYDYEKASMQIIAVEDLVSTHIGGYLLTGRLDLAYRDLSGRVFVVDHKTTGRITKNHKTFYGMSGQLLAYKRMAQETYGNVAGVKVNLLQLATDKANAKFERVDLPVSPFLEASFEQVVIDIEHSIERQHEENREYTEWPKAATELTCFTRYGACDFIDRCRFGPQAMKGGNWTWKG